MKPASLSLKAVAVCVLLSALSFHAQSARQTLPGHLRPAVARGQAVPAGLMPSSERMNLSIVLPLRNQADLASLLNGLYDPSSADFHQFLTTQQFAERFAPSEDDYQAVAGFARANGFTVGAEPANRLVVPVSGTVDQVEKAFNVKMALYRHPTENRLFFSPDREPSVDLAVPIAHIAGLNNFSTPRPMYKRAAADSVIVSDANTGSGPGGAFLASDMRTAYYGGAALTGSGQTVALFEYDGYQLSDVNLTFSSVGQTAPATGVVQNVLLDGATGASVSGDDSEEVLDIVQSIGMAPGLSQVRVYIGNNDSDILSSIAAENLAKEVSISWSWSPDDPSTDDIFFEEMAAQGQSVFASSGDRGEFDPYFDAFYPAEDPYVTAVGGTHLATKTPGGAWAAELAWQLSGGGVSPDGIPIPAYQVGIATSNNGGSNTLRNVPDVAAQADTSNYNCAMGSCAGDFGGTSFSAPRWAAYTALINQQAVSAGDPVAGFLNPAIYAIGEGSSYDSDFHDITIGSNNARSNCCGWPYYNAVPGYDLVTGWGSPNGLGLINALAPTVTAGFNLAASATVLTVNPGSSGSLSVNVAATGGFTGSVNFTISGLPTGVTATWMGNPSTTGAALRLGVSSTAVRGTSLVTVTGTSGSLTATTSFALVINAPGFTLEPSPASLTIYPGTSSTASVVVTGFAGFAGQVNFAITSALPAGVTASWIGNPTGNTATLTLSAGSSATANTDAEVTITGTSGSLTATATLALVVAPPPFTLSIVPYPSTIVQGGSVTATVTSVPLNGSLTDTIHYSMPQYPTGVTATFNPPSAPLGQSTTLTLTAASTAPTGTGLASIEADGTSFGTNSQFNITVTSKATASFTLTPAQSTLTLMQGSSITDGITINAQNGFTGNVSFAITSAQPSMPNGITAAFSPNPGSTSSQLNISAANTASAGVYTLWITGTSGTQSAVATVLLTINPPPGFSLSASPAPLSITQGLTATDTVTVTPQTGFSGSVNLAVTSGLPAGLTAAFAPASTATGSQLTFTAGPTVTPGSYSVIIAGTSSGRTVTTVLPVTVVAAPAVPTTTRLAISPTGALFVGSSYTLTATVTPTTGTGVPSGTVVFTIAGVTQVVTLKAGVATLPATAPLVPGNLVISATYGGTPAFTASNSNTLNETVVGVATTTALSISPSGGSLPAGSAFTLTATVIAESGTLVPSGTVIFNVGATTQTVALNSSGVATYNGTVPTAAGSFTVSAAYQGNSTFGASTSVIFDENVAAIPTGTSLSIAPGGGALTAGSPFTLTATVTATAGTVTPAGSVEFNIGGVTQAAALNASGVATYAGNVPLTPGNLPIYARYMGGQEFSTSQSLTLNETVVPLATATTLAISPATGSLDTGESYTLTATVTAPGSAAVPTGSVVFTIGTQTLPATLNSAGVATYTGTAPSTSGTIALSASYQAQGEFGSSISNLIEEPVSQALTPGFSMTSTAINITPGAASGNASVITITPSNGFSGAVTLTAQMADMPIAAQDPPSFSFGSTAVANLSGSGATTATLTITTTAPPASAAVTRPRMPGPSAPWYASGGAALACLLLFGIPTRRRRWQSLLGAVVLLFALAGGAIGCGGIVVNKSGTTTGANTGTTPGIYLITVTGTSGSASSSTTVSLTVQ